MSRLTIDLPDDISDETAFHLKNILLGLAEAVGSQYLGEIMRHIEAVRSERFTRTEDPPVSVDPLNPF